MCVHSVNSLHMLDINPLDNFQMIIGFLFIYFAVVCHLSSFADTEPSLFPYLIMVKDFFNALLHMVCIILNIFRSIFIRNTGCIFLVFVWV